MSAARRVMRGSNARRVSRTTAAVLFVAQLFVILSAGPHAIGIDVAVMLPLLVASELRARRTGFVITEDALRLIGLVRVRSVPWPSIEYFWEGTGSSSTVRLELTGRRWPRRTGMRVPTLFWVEPPSRWSRWYGRCDIDYGGEVIAQEGLVDFFEAERIRRSPADRRNHVFPGSPVSPRDTRELDLADPAGGGPFWACRLLMRDGRQVFVRLRDEPFASLRMVREWLVASSITDCVDAAGRACSPGAAGSRPRNWGQSLFGVDAPAVAQTPEAVGLTADDVRAWRCKPSDLPVLSRRLTAYGIVALEATGELAQLPVFGCFTLTGARRRAARFAEAMATVEQPIAIAVIRKRRSARAFPDDPPVLTLPTRRTELPLPSP